MNFEAYAQCYDLLYKDKDYKSEAKFISNVLLQNGVPCPSVDKPIKLLELGCGTGGHALELVQLGYHIDGIDRSHQMIDMAICRRDSNESHANAKNFYPQKAEISEFRNNTQYDAVISLFHVMSYHNTNADVDAMWLTASEHLKPGGLFIFDFWHGPGVLTDLPQARIKEMEDDTIRATRFTQPQLRSEKNIVEINYDVIVQSKLTNDLQRFKEKHFMRYFFRPEIELFAQQYQLEILGFHSWMSHEELATNNWFGWLIARKVALNP